jgi:hypothetical protein
MSDIERPAAVPPRADIAGREREVAFAPEAAVGHAAVDSQARQDAALIRAFKIEEGTTEFRQEVA